ncbi:sigma-54 dependent transcriptional regulator [Desulfosarcina sp. OttesenSCG-928-A07]|nr:sigma-54 dependent transcriptional regulator [Desulfosarcina sp. OttesenSCG-928-A07]
METILIVDDEPNYTLILSAVLEDAGFEALTANSGAEALTILSRSDVDLVLTDMKMPEMDGIALLDQIKQTDADLPVILMTAHGTIEKAVAAMQKGAYHYILKPFDNEELVIYVNKAISMYRVIKENRQLRSAVEDRFSFQNIIGKSKAMQDVFAVIRKVAPASATVLVEGASGTGKELVASALHFNSPRKDRPFVAVNCSALAETLLESELFGHEKGAFTNAMAMKKGRFELADGGTLFLDEIGELAAGLQVKLLRVLQERVIERVGGTRPIPVNIRLIAATNKSLRAEVAAGNFREDLFYRLNVVRITLPPLHERTGDIRPLVHHFIAKHQAERGSGTPVTDIDPAVERLFYEYHWPGNIRELENVIEYAVVMAADPVIQISDLPKDFMDAVHGTLHMEGIPVNANLYDTLSHVEKNMILRALDKANYVQAHAAEMLGIGKSGLNQKIKKYNLLGKNSKG